MNTPHRLNNIEVGDIFRQYGAAYRKSRKLPLQSLKAMSAIESCRTAALGGHVDECDSCGHLRNSYNSCRNRHCPKMPVSGEGAMVGSKEERVASRKLSPRSFNNTV